MKPTPAEQDYSDFAPLSDAELTAIVLENLRPDNNVTNSTEDSRHDSTN